VRPLIFNATPLIYITKVGLSKIFEGLEEEKLTAPHVKKEVVDEGKLKGIPDGIILERIFQNKVFKVTKPEDQKFLAALLKTKGLDVTVAEVLAIAKERDGIAVIDDEVARKTAKIYGITYVGTPYILVKAITQKLIAKQRAKQVINEMVFAGWRCSVESYAKIVDAIEKL
jgi:predicted nucleic acid-binding protein